MSRTPIRYAAPATLVVGAVLLSTTTPATAVTATASPASVSAFVPTVAPARAARVGAGHPSVRVVRDPRHDVVLSGVDGDRAAPGRREGDLVRVRVRYTATAVRVRVAFARLTHPRAATDVGFVPVTLRTPGQQYTAGVTYDVTSPDGTPFIEGGGQGDFTCPGLTSHVRYGRDVVRLRVPRACLGDAAWVRVGVGAVTAAGEGATYADAAPGRSLGSERTIRRVWHPAG